MLVHELRVWKLEKAKLADATNPIQLRAKMRLDLFTCIHCIARETRAKNAREAEKIGNVWNEGRSSLFDVTISAHGAHDWFLNHKNLESISHHLSAKTRPQRLNRITVSFSTWSLAFWVRMDLCRLQANRWWNRLRHPFFLLGYSTSQKS